MAEMSSANRYCVSTNIKSVLADHLTKSFTVLDHGVKEGSEIILFLPDYHCLPWIRKEGNCLLSLHAIDKNGILIKLTLPLAEYCPSAPV